jgi:glyoxylase-like metal-dependent hydrolase (beta-lactamase superfamily II)
MLTPGHSPAHACLHHAPSRTLLVGDHVLPHITPNITISPDALDDPLAAYRQSLKKIQGQGYRLALPGHGEPIRNLDNRIDDILQHHEDREDLLLSLLAEGPRTCEELAEGLFQISTLNAWENYMAIGATLAHLRALERAGRVKSVKREGSIHFQQVTCNA